MVAFAYMTWVERKLLGRMQQRYGPNRAGPFGLLQPIADLVKLLRKEHFYPAAAIDVLYIGMPVLAGVHRPAVLRVIPWGAGWHIGGYYVTGWIVDVPISLILLFALGSLGIYGFIVGGWACESKYSLLGSMRTCAQMVSYEVSLALSRARRRDHGPLALAGGHRPASSTPRSGSSARSSSASSSSSSRGIAETNRPPFDLPEADTELVAGYHTEYSGMRFGLFQMAEYVNMITLSGLAVTLFFGGWDGPWAPSGRSGSCSSCCSSSSSSSGSARRCRACATTS